MAAVPSILLRSDVFARPGLLFQCAACKLRGAVTEAATLCAKRGRTLEMGMFAEYDTIKPLLYPDGLRL